MVSLISCPRIISALVKLAHSLSNTSNLSSAGGSYGLSRYVPSLVLILPNNVASSLFSATHSRFSPLLYDAKSPAWALASA